MNELLEEAQRKLAKAAMKQPGNNPLSFAISAYVNGLLMSCRVDALVDLYLNPPNDTWTKQEAFDAAVLRAVLAKTEQLEANVQSIAIASPADRTIMAAH